jgi:hypothetical protein
MKNEDDNVADEGNEFTPWAVRRQMATSVAQSQQCHDVNIMEW